MDLSDPEKVLQTILRVCPSHQNFSLLLASFKSSKLYLAQGRMSLDKYDTRMAELRSSIQYFFKQLPRDKQAKIQSELGGDGNAVITPTIAFIGSSPKNVSPIQTDFEYKKISATTGRGNVGTHYRVLPRVISASVQELISVLIGETPSHVHFSCHSSPHGLALCNEANEYVLLTNEVLGEIFRAVDPVYKKAGKKMELIFLNACYSEEQVKLISGHCDYSIGLEVAFLDDAAVTFSEAFYTFLSDMRSPDADIEACFRLALAVLHSKFPASAGIPRLWKGNDKIY